MRRAFNLSLSIIIAVAVAAGCEQKKAGGGATAADPAADPAAKPAPPRKKPAPATLAARELPRTKLTIQLPAGAKVSEALVAGADQINFPGIQSAMVVKPRLVTDKELEKLVPWAKGHKIQKFGGEVLKQGSGKTYSYMYKATLGAKEQVIYHQMFQVDGKDYVCFANADDEAAAKAFKRSCDTIAGGATPPAKGAKKAAKEK